MHRCRILQWSYSRHLHHCVRVCTLSTCLCYFCVRLTCLHMTCAPNRWVWKFWLYQRVLTLFCMLAGIVASISAHEIIMYHLSTFVGFPKPFNLSGNCLALAPRELGVFSLGNILIVSSTYIAVLRPTLMPGMSLCSLDASERLVRPFVTPTLPVTVWLPLYHHHGNYLAGIEASAWPPI